MRGTGEVHFVITVSERSGWRRLVKQHIEYHDGIECIDRRCRSILDYIMLST